MYHNVLGEIDRLLLINELGNNMSIDGHMVDFVS